VIRYPILSLSSRKATYILQTTYSAKVSFVSKSLRGKGHLLTNEGNIDQARAADPGTLAVAICRYHRWRTITATNERTAGRRLDTPHLPLRTCPGSADNDRSYINIVQTID
jgi:hypothetical protein